VPLDAGIRVEGHPSLDLVELTLTKLQIVESNPKDLNDVAGLLAVTSSGRPRAARRRPSRRSLASDWGLWRTVTANLDRLASAASEGQLPAEPADRRRACRELRGWIDRAASRFVESPRKRSASESPGMTRPKT